MRCGGRARHRCRRFGRRCPTAPPERRRGPRALPTDRPLVRRCGSAACSPGWPGSACCGLAACRRIRLVRHGPCRRASRVLRSSCSSALSARPRQRHSRSSAMRPRSTNCSAAASRSSGAVRNLQDHADAVEELAPQALAQAQGLRKQIAAVLAERTAAAAGGCAAAHHRRARRSPAQRCRRAGRAEVAAGQRRGRTGSGRPAADADAAHPAQRRSR